MFSFIESKSVHQAFPKTTLIQSEPRYEMPSFPCGTKVSFIYVRSCLKTKHEKKVYSRCLCMILKIKIQIYIEYIN